MKRAVNGVSAFDSKNSFKRWGPVAGVAVALVLTVVGIRASFGSSLEKAVLAVESAPSPAEKNAKIEVVRTLLAQEQDESVRQYWSGRLQEAREDANAADYYAAAARLGNSGGEDRLIALLDHKKCRFRVASLAAIGELKLKRAKARVEQLATSGGEDDGEKLLFLGCNSKSDAASVLRQLE